MDVVQIVKARSGVRKGSVRACQRGTVFESTAARERYMLVFVLGELVFVLGEASGGRSRGEQNMSGYVERRENMGKHGLSRVGLWRSTFVCRGDKIHHLFFFVRKVFFGTRRQL